MQSAAQRGLSACSGLNWKAVCTMTSSASPVVADQRAPPLLIIIASLYGVPQCATHTP